jgi:hypothetical protein
MSNIAELVECYVSVWNEPDADARRRRIAELWTEDGVHFIPSLEARGYEAIEGRVTRAHERFVTGGGYVFRSANNAEEHHNGVRFNWEMVPAGGGEVASSGFDFLILGDDGRIVSDHQFVDQPPPV